MLNRGLTNALQYHLPRLLPRQPPRRRRHVRILHPCLVPRRQSPPIHHPRRPTLCLSPPDWPLRHRLRCLLLPFNHPSIPILHNNRPLHSLQTPPLLLRRQNHPPLVPRNLDLPRRLQRPRRHRLGRDLGPLWPLLPHRLPRPHRAPLVHGTNLLPTHVRRPRPRRRHRGLPPKQRLCLHRQLRQNGPHVGRQQRLPGAHVYRPYRQRHGISLQPQRKNPRIRRRCGNHHPLGSRPGETAEAHARPR